jgi:hypothetical protein
MPVKPTPQEYDDHQTLFYDFRRELKDLCRSQKPGDYSGFKNTVSVMAILRLEERYALAENRMFDRIFKGVKAACDRSRELGTRATPPDQQTTSIQTQKEDGQ